MGAWIVLALFAFTKAALTAGSGAQFVFVLLGCILLLCFWAALRWPGLLR